MRLNSLHLNKIGKMLDFYSQFNPSPLSIKQFYEFGKYIYCNFFREKAPLAAAPLKVLLTFCNCSTKSPLSKNPLFFSGVSSMSLQKLFKFEPLNTFLLIYKLRGEVGIRGYIGRDNKHKSGKSQDSGRSPES